MREEITIFYYSFNIGDYSSHTKFISKMGDLAYRRLMDWYYLHEKPVPENVQKAAEEIGMADEIDEVDRVLKRYFELEIGVGWRSKRCDEEIERTNRISETARTNGAKGGRRKGSKDSKPRKQRAKTQGLADANPGLSKNEPPAKRQPSKGLATRNPIPNTQDPIHSASNEAGAGAPIDLPDLFPPTVDTFIPPQRAPDDLDDNPPPNPRSPAENALEGPYVAIPGHEFQDDVSEIWGQGKALLKHFGINHAQAGKLIGKWVRDARDEKLLLDAIRGAIRAGTQDPASYITKVIKEGNAGRGRREYAGDLRGLDYSPPPNFDTSEEFHQ